MGNPLVLSIQDEDVSGSEWTCERLEDVANFARVAYYAARLWSILRG